MLEVLIWWLIIELVGFAILPVAFRFFRNIPDRGYAFSKPLGLLLIAYLFWLLTTLGFFTNTRGAIALVAMGVAALAWWFGARRMTDDERPTLNDESPFSVLRPSSLFEWLRANISLVLATELVFTLAFFAWAFVRAHMPEITATEKPMEFAFLNGVLQSEHFPPLDPWLSGYAISYYYFGYIIAALLTMLSGVPSSYAFNLMIALLFALGVTGAFGLAYNLIRQATVNGKQPIDQALISNHQSLFFALFAPFFLVLIGNLEGFFEALHAKGIGAPRFWEWLDVKGLADASVTNTFTPRDNWWWWRASRVVHDVVMGQTQEVIDEFPQFSFLLGDMHPHVLALPFVLLALAVALNLLKSRLESRDWELKVGNRDIDFVIRHSSFVIYPLILGGLFFLNSWDILPYGFILVAAFAIARYRIYNEWNRDATRDLAVFVIALGGLSVLLYLPFYLGFQSQAGGVLPTLFVKTRLHQYLIMFGLFVFVLGAFLARLFVERSEIRTRVWLHRALTPLTVIGAFPILVMVFALVVIAASPHLAEQARAAFPGGSDNFVVSVLFAYFAPLVSDPWLFVLLAVFLSALFVLAREYLADDSVIFVLLLVFTGLLLTFGVEFVYLRDQFGTRMNTVFKFYFQTWTLLSIASAYAVFYLARKLNSIARVAWFVGFALLFGASIVYPALAIPSRVDDFARPPTLDGIAWIREFNPGDYAAIQWLGANAPRGAVTLEAPGGEYSYGNRISMATGLPTVLGWAGHESQWRGNSKFFKDDAAGIDRAADVRRIYETIDSKELLTYLDKYAIKFVVVGQTEKNTYGLTKTQIEKFGKVMTLVFENGDARIYGR
jgi:YYY domain-containing protein